MSKVDNYGLIIITSASIVNYYCKEVQNDILIYKNFQSYTVVVKKGTSFPMSIQWQLMLYTKYGNSSPIQNMATCAKMPHHCQCTQEGLSILLPTLRAPRCNSKIDLPLLRARGSSVLLAASTTSPWALKQQQSNVNSYR